MLDEKLFFKSDKDISNKSQRNLKILELLRRRGPLSRTDISKVSGINPVTVSHYIDKLINHEMVYEKEYDVSSGGRRPLLLDINPEAAYTIGISVNIYSSCAVIVDLDGKVVYRTSREHNVATPNDLINELVSLADEVYDNTNTFMEKIQGIGIGLGGIVDNDNHTIRWPSGSDASYASVSIPVKQYFHDKFQLPVCVANDANLACFAEHWLQLDNDIKDVLYMYGGVSCGLMINGEMYKGAHGCAGELFVNIPDSDAQSSMGNFSFLSGWSLDMNLISQANELLVSNGKTEMVNNLKEVFALNVDGMSSILDQAARSLGIKIAFMINILNPQVVIVGGGFEQGGYTFIEKIKSYVKQYAFADMLTDTKIIASALGSEATALGAANMVVKNVFAYA